MKSPFELFANPDTPIHREWVATVANDLMSAHAQGNPFPNPQEVSDPILSRLLSIAIIKAQGRSLIDAS